jgi:hypothetical protein
MAEAGWWTAPWTGEVGKTVAFVWCGEIRGSVDIHYPLSAAEGVFSSIIMENYSIHSFYLFFHTNTSLPKYEHFLVAFSKNIKL